MSRSAVEGWIKAETPAVQDALRSLNSSGTLLEFDDTQVHADAFGVFRRGIVKRLEDFHRKNPLKHGMPKEELRAQLRIPHRTFNGLIASLKEVMGEKDLIRLKAFRASLSEEDKTKVLDVLEKAGFQPPTKAELSAALKMDEKLVEDILKLMHREGSAVRINDTLYLSSRVYERMMGLLKGFFGEKAEMTVSEFRDLLGTTRKYALPLLEYMDSNRITLRVGDVRKSLLK
jgi:selenocysteine-specific elongation factor